MSAPIHSNGFAPRRSKDGQWVLSGFGTATLYGLVAGLRYDFEPPNVGGVFPCGHLHDDLPMIVADQGGPAQGYVIRSGLIHERMRVEQSHLVAIMSADGGHWAAGTTAGIYFDDRLLPGSSAGSTLNGVTLKRPALFPIQRGPHVLAKIDINQPNQDIASGYILRRWEDGHWREDIHALDAYYYDLTEDGGWCWLAPGWLMVLMPDGRLVNAWVSQSGSEGTPCLADLTPGDRWVWTSLEDASGWCVVGRRPGEQDVIRVDMPAAWLEVKVIGGAFELTASDGLGGLRVARVDQNAQRVRLTAPQPALHLSRPIWQGYFKHAGEPALCYVDETHTPALIKTTATGAVVAIHAEGRDDPAAVAKEANAQATQSERALYRRPVVGTCDNFLPTGRISGVDILGVEVYALTQTETPVDIVTRVTNCLNRLPANQQVCLVGQAYDRRGAPPFENGWYLGDGVGLQWATAKLAEHPSVIMVLWFSGGARKGGVGDHPELLPAHAALLASNPGIPAFPTIASPPVPPAPPTPPTPQPPGPPKPPVEEPTMFDPAAIPRDVVQAAERRLIAWRKQVGLSPADAPDDALDTEGLTYMITLWVSKLILSSPVPPGDYTVPAEDAYRYMVAAIAREHHVSTE